MFEFHSPEHSPPGAEHSPLSLDYFEMHGIHARQAGEIKEQGKEEIKCKKWNKIIKREK